MFLCRLLLVVLSTQGLMAMANPCPNPVCNCYNIERDGHSYLDVHCHPETGDKLTSVPEGLSSQTIYLDLSENSLAYLPDEAFSAAGLVNLININLRHNLILTVGKDAFKKLGKLRQLNLQHNGIQCLHADTFRDNAELTDVLLSHNPITRFDDGLFANMPELIFVVANFCKLSYIGPKTFENVPKLRTISLMENELAQLDVSLLMRQSHLLQSDLILDLEGNPWNCDCHLKYWKDHMAKVADSPTCAEPPQLANKTWQEIQPENFVC